MGASIPHKSKLPRCGGKGSFMKLQHMTWPQVQSYFATNDTVIIGVGSCENHGMHMPLGTDALVPDKLISLVEERVQVLCAPMVPFGSCEYFSDFPGTVSLGDEVLYQVLFHIAEGLYRAGGRHFVFMNGHGGNIPAIERVCYGLSKKGAVGAVMNWWSMAGSFDPAWAGGHGGGEETAAILYINPDLVDRTAMKPGDIADVSEGIRAITLKNAEFRGVQIPIPRDARKICNNGWVGADDIMTATPQWGEQMLTTIADYIADFIREFAKAPLR